MAVTRTPNPIFTNCFLIAFSSSWSLKGTEKRVPEVELNPTRRFRNRCPKGVVLYRDTLSPRLSSSPKKVLPTTH